LLTIETSTDFAHESGAKHRNVEAHGGVLLF
jgi:hypothetical protein